MLVGGMAMGRRSAQRQMSMQEEAYQQGQQAQQQATPKTAPPPPPPTAAPPQKDVVAELQKLGDLHISGVLTDEEFAAAKKKLLS
jgi:membrane protease subunit (stomatin/prohibitin family)